MNLWIVLEDPHDDLEYGFVGIFDDRQKAIEACYNEFCFVEPCVLNENMGSGDLDWQENFYPLAPDKGILNA